MLRKILYLTLLIAITSTICSAASNTPVWVSAGGYDVIKIRTGSAGMTLAKRAEVVQERMNTFVGMKTSTNQMPKITLKSTPDKSIEIWGGGLKIIQVQQRDADATKMSVTQLANQWKQAIEKVYPLATPNDIKNLPPTPKINKKKFKII